MTTEKRLMAHAELTRAIAEACLAALKAGLEREAVTAALETAKELVEADE